MKIGLFGGTFNPIHFGHLRAAMEVKDQYKLNKIYLIPSARPPHKNNDDIIHQDYRYNMLNKAVENMNHFFVSDVEINRSGPSYAIDTIKYFQKKSTVDTYYFFILGTDAFLELNTWKSYKELLEIVTFIVIIRPFKKKVHDNKIIQNLENFIHSKLSKNYTFFSEISSFLHLKMYPINVFKVVQLDISSTQIRNLIKQGESIQFLIPESVEEYIINKGLYI